tara:strand:- start:4902 stop:5402 length:501 start_codon:yes stop_codon:yes gene_type:complete
MIRLLLPLLLLLFIVWAFKHSRQLPAAQRRAFIWRISIIALIAATVILTIAGKMHWLGALIAASIPFAGKAISVAMRVLPFWQAQKNRQSKAKQRDQDDNKPKKSVDMDIVEAQEVLGLTEQPSRDDIVDAHRKLMQRIHPDRGGSDHLAAKVNQAKETLLDNLKS